MIKKIVNFLKKLNIFQKKKKVFDKRFGFDCSLARVLEGVKEPWNENFTIRCHHPYQFVQFTPPPFPPLEPAYGCVIFHV